VNLSDASVALLSRVFGPRLSAELASEFVPAKGVDIANASDAETALNCLLQYVVCCGLGGSPAGWRVSDADGRSHLTIYRFKAAAELAGK
jgi:hypothetical protein